MLRMTTALLISIALPIAFATASSAHAGASPQGENTLRTFRLRVESATTGRAIRVRGALWVDGSARRVEIIDQTTPYQLTVVGNIVNGIFEAEHNAEIRVDLTDVTTGRQRLERTGETVVLAQGLAPNSDSAFIR
jgi:hypothetical protein